MPQKTTPPVAPGQGRTSADLASTAFAFGGLILFGALIGIVAVTAWPKLVLVALLGVVVWGVSREGK